MERSQGKHSLCGGWSVCHEVMENVLHIILSLAASTVPSLVGTQNMCLELFSNFSWPPQRSLSCPHAAASRSAPRNNIYSKDLCAGVLGKLLPSRIPLLLPHSVAFERTGTARDSLLYPTSETLTDDGQEHRPTIKLYFLFQPIERGDKYTAQLL